MTRNDTEMEGEASEANNSATAQHAAAPGVSSGQLPPFAMNALQSLAGNQQLPFLDSNVMLMSNATLAAVAASTIQQLNQAKSAIPPTNAASATPQVTQSLLAALRTSGLAGSASNSALPPHVAALLAAGASHPGLQVPAASTTTVSPHLQQVLRQETSSLRPSAASALVNSSTSASTSGTMQGWTVDQLEKHVGLLQRMKKPIPQSVALLLADAQRKERKKTAKRAANRKSASTSRARKKALVEEMTRTNARLRRQALILALLPDLVIATTLDGDITFCSAQVERVLKHKHDELIGASLSSLLVPASRDVLKKITSELLNPAGTKGEATAQTQPQKARRSSKRRHEDKKDSTEQVEAKRAEKNNNSESNASARASLSRGGSSGEKGAAMVSDRSFPLSIVNVESKKSSRLAAPSKQMGDVTVDTANNVNSDNSTSNNSGSKQQVSSLSNATGLSRSTNESQSEDDAGQRGSPEVSKTGKETAKAKQHTSSDDSSLSSDAKNMRKANDNLDRNVRWHNQRMMEDNQKTSSDNGPKDDVTGASVTANNASARLSSLQHLPETRVKKEEKANGYENNGDQSSSDDSLLAGVEEKKKVENQSDDSGYRESNDSREETSSSGSDSSNLNDRQKPLVPTYRLCLIRDDLTTVWCEVTSSLRTQATEGETPDVQASNKPSPSAMDSAKPDSKEMLLCLRPIRDGEKKVDESLRFVSPRVSSSDDSTPVEAIVSASSPKSSSGMDKESLEKTSSGDGSNGNSLSSENVDISSPKRPPKKRLLSEEQGEVTSPVAKKIKPNDNEKKQPGSTDTEKSVVESLMLMNKSQ